MPPKLPRGSLLLVGSSRSPVGGGLHRGDHFPGILLHHRDHLGHAFLDFADLGMHLLDEVVFYFRKFFDAPALFAQLVHHPVLFGGNPLHPPEADDPARGADNRHPERRAVLSHAIYPAESGARGRDIRNTRFANRGRNRRGPTL